jgi:hypothetical protein
LGGTYLALGHEDGDALVQARGDGKVGHALDAQLGPDGRQVVAVVELHLVGDDAGAILLVRRILQVPARLRLLDELSERLLLGALGQVLDGAPDLEVLGGVAVFVLGRAFPRAQICPTGREAELVDGRDRERRQHVADRSVDNDDTIARGVGEVSATGRVDTAPEVPFGLGEPRKGFVDRGGIEDADGLLGSVGKLQRIRHD